jgi:hypothetical protein
MEELEVNREHHGGSAENGSPTKRTFSRTNQGVLARCGARELWRT